MRKKDQVPISKKPTLRDHVTISTKPTLKDITLLLITIENHLKYKDHGDLTLDIDFEDPPENEIQFEDVPDGGDGYMVPNTNY